MKHLDLKGQAWLDANAIKNILGRMIEQTTPPKRYDEMPNPWELLDRLHGEAADVLQRFEASFANGPATKEERRR